MQDYQSQDCYPWECNGWNAMQVKQSGAKKPNIACRQAGAWNGRTTPQSSDLRTFVTCVSNIIRSMQQWGDWLQQAVPDTIAAKDRENKRLYTAVNKKQTWACVGQGEASRHEVG